MKKLARKITSNAKRDLAQTGNKNLRSSTVRAIQTSECLLVLRNNLGPTATGFKSNHCSDAKETTSIAVQPKTTNENKSTHAVEFDEPLFSQLSSNISPRPIRKRKRTEFPGSGMSQYVQSQMNIYICIVWKSIF